MFRIFVILSFLSLLPVTACSSSRNCVVVGDDLFKNLELVTDLANRLDLPTEPLEAAHIVGWAKAVSQREGGQQGVPVAVCLRSGTTDDTEFRIVSTGGRPLDEWRSVAESRATSNE